MANNPGETQEHNHWLVVRNNSPLMYIWIIMLQSEADTSRLIVNRQTKELTWHFENGNQTILSTCMCVREQTRFPQSSHTKGLKMRAHQTSCWDPTMFAGLHSSHSYKPWIVISSYFFLISYFKSVTSNCVISYHQRPYYVRNSYACHEDMLLIFILGLEAIYHNV